MRKAIKKQGKSVRAYELGTDSRQIQQWIEEGKIKKISEQEYEIFSQEAVNGTGQITYKGDFIKVDTSGMPYPNSREFFLANHKYIRDDEYEQIPKPVSIWQSQEAVVPEIEFLIKNKGFIIDKNNKEKYYTAPLWGTLLSAAEDAYVVFYVIERNEEGAIIDVDYNFVENAEFHRTYHIL